MEDKIKKLELLKEEMLKDTSLPLRKTATNLVFADGKPSEIMFIGEGPGYWEDQKGIPFVGNAGAFLNQLLNLAGLKREEVFITNVVHFRPPENRDPEPSELEAFGKYLDKMIKIVNPKIIVTLGRFSMGKFLPGSYISNIHGKPKEINFKGENVVVVPMFHPAAGLRNPEVKIKTQEDFKDLSSIINEIKMKEKEKKDKTEQISLI